MWIEPDSATAWNHESLDPAVCGDDFIHLCRQVREGLVETFMFKVIVVVFDAPKTN